MSKDILKDWPRFFATKSELKFFVETAYLRGLNDKTDTIAVYNYKFYPIGTQFYTVSSTGAISVDIVEDILITIGGIYHNWNDKNGSSIVYEDMIMSLDDAIEQSNAIIRKVLEQ